MSKKDPEKAIGAAIVFVVLVAVVSQLCIYGFFMLMYRDRIYFDSNQIPEKRVALVLGAGVNADGSPSLILQKRVEAGVALYKKGKVKKLLLSGDNREVRHNEPHAMKLLAIELGVPEEDIQEDFAGRSTYESCARAKSVFSLDEVIIVTQDFHINRALFLCEKLGLKTYGYVADSAYTTTYFYYLEMREILARIKALTDVYVYKPDVVEGEKITL